MLEVLLTEYEARFGTKFPLDKFKDKTEIEVINILYVCMRENKPYEPGMTAPTDMFPDAPKRS